MSEPVKFQTKKVIQAKRPSVYQAWTDPALIGAWFAPGELTSPFSEIDLKVGGVFKVSMEGMMRGQQTTGHVSGIYQKIVPNELLVFTFRGTWEHVPDSTVTVEFKDVDGGTEITLTHEGIIDAQNGEGKRQGWLSSIEKLSRAFSK
jgi:uncharacterized protein YndB with AHSA1/START domain